jgi:hypothetical protein
MTYKENVILDLFHFVSIFCRVTEFNFTTVEIITRTHFIKAPELIRTKYVSLVDGFSPNLSEFIGFALLRREERKMREEVKVSFKNNLFVTPQLKFIVISDV